jgi:hypothetical protein
MPIATPQLKDETSGILQWPTHKVYVRQSLKTGKWVETPYLDPVELIETACPGVSRAVLAYQAGNVLHADASAFTLKSSLNLRGYFVRIDLIGPAAEEEGGGGETPPPLLRSWVGWISGDERRIGGTTDDGLGGATGPQPVEQRLMAIDLAGYLDLIQIYGAWLFDPNAPEGSDGHEGRHVASAIAFNEQGQYGLKRYGNRSAQKVTVPDSDPPRKAYAFDAQPRADKSLSDEWSVRDIAEHLLAFYCDAFDVHCALVATEGGAPYDSAYQIAVGDALAGLRSGRFLADGATVKTSLDALFTAGRGVGWCLRTSQEEEDRPENDPPGADVPVRVQLHVFPILSTALNMAVITLPANAEQMTVDASIDPAVLECVVGEHVGEQYASVIAEGEFHLSCFTVSVADGTLVADWTDGEEADYIKAAKLKCQPKGSAGHDGPPPEVDELDALDHVFCRLRLPWDWDGEAGDGVGGSKNLVMPKLASDGVFTPDVATLNRMRRGFEDLLPLESPVRPMDADYNPAAQPYYRKAFAVVRWPKDTSDGSTPSYADRWAYLHAPPHPKSLAQPSCDLYMVQDRHAVRCEFTSPHSLANSQGWTLPNGSFIDSARAEPAYYSWRELIATVALRTDQRLFVRRDIAESTSDRTLRIYVPDAELWTVAAGTVTGIKSDGTLVRQDGPSAPRDDSLKCAQVASMAAAWFGATRQSLAVRWAGFKSGFLIGGYVTGTTMHVGGTSVNLPLTSVAYNFEARTTAIACQFREISFAGVT